MKNNNKITLSLIVTVSLILSLFLNVLSASALTGAPVLSLDVGSQNIDSVTGGYNLPVSVSNTYNNKGVFGVIFRVNVQEDIMPIDSVQLTPDNGARNTWDVTSGTAELLAEGGMLTYIGNEVSGFQDTSAPFTDMYIAFQDHESHIGETVNLNVEAEIVYGTSDANLETSIQTFDPMTLTVGEDIITINLTEVSADQIRGQVSDNVSTVEINGNIVDLSGGIFSADTVSIDTTAPLDISRRIEIKAIPNEGEAKYYYILVGNFCSDLMNNPCADAVHETVNTTDLGYLSVNWDSLGAYIASLLKVNFGRKVNPETGVVSIGSNPVVDGVSADPNFYTGEVNTQFTVAKIEVSIQDNYMLGEKDDVELTLFDPNGNEIDTNGTQQNSEEKSYQVYVYTFNDINIPANNAIYGTYNAKVIATDGNGNITTQVVKDVFSYDAVGNQTVDAVDDNLATNFETAVDIDVLANDTGVDPLTIKEVTSPGNGTATILTTTRPHKIQYIPNNGYEGIDTFEYLLVDGKQNEDTAKVQVTVKAKEQQSTP